MSRTFGSLRKSEERQQIRESDGDSDGGREGSKEGRLAPRLLGHCVSLLLISASGRAKDDLDNCDTRSIRMKQEGREGVTMRMFS